MKAVSIFRLVLSKSLHLKSTLNIVSLSIAVKYLQIHCLCVFELALIDVSISTKIDFDLILSILWFVRFPYWPCAKLIELKFWLQIVRAMGWHCVKPGTIHFCVLSSGRKSKYKHFDIEAKNKCFTLFVIEL